MANLPETPQWEDGIYQIEVSDPVLGGPDGISNRQAKQLAKRTSYLKQQVESGDKNLADHIAAPNPHTQYAPKESPALTGTPTAPTPTKTDNSTKLATTGHVKNVVADYAPLASPALTGKPTAPTAAQASNDTQLATTAFVKAALAALVASSPEALDTLNELAAALGNDPNFATTMTNALAGKQPLDNTLTALSGKSVSALLEYLGLGTSATATLTTSKTDNKLGRVLKVGDFGLNYQTYGVMPDNTSANSRSSMGLGFSRLYKSADSPGTDAHYNLIMMPETLGGVYSALAISDNSTPSYRGYGDNDSDPITWVKLYDEKNKPTPDDIGALPAIGGTLTGALEIASDAPCIQFTETDTGKKFFIVADSGGLRINQDTLSGVNGILRFDPATKNWTLPGGVIPKNYDNFLSLFQKINQASLGTNGWFKDTNTGLIIQWGIGGGVGAAKNYPIQFPIAFPSRCLSIQVTLQSTSWDANSGSALAQIIDNTKAYCWSTHSFFWFAIGL